MNDLITATTALALANKLLGKTGELIASDLAEVYSVGRNKILDVFAKKVTNPKDPWQTNLRVTKDVFLNGSFSDESVCAEYFGGILASSRSSDGKDDRGVYYVDIIKSLSSHQLFFHYIIYNSLNKYWSSLPPESVHPNPGMGTEIGNINLWMPTIQLEKIGIQIDKDVFALQNKGLIHDELEANQIQLGDKRMLPYVKVGPSTLGIQVYSVANNKLNQWREFSKTDFGDFETIDYEVTFALNKADLLKKLNLEEKNDNN